MEVLKLYVNLVIFLLKLAIALSALGGASFLGWEARGKVEAFKSDPTQVVRMLVQSNAPGK